MESRGSFIVAAHDGEEVPRTRTVRFIYSLLSNTAARSRGETEHITGRRGVAGGAVIRRGKSVEADVGFGPAVSENAMFVVGSL